jgi:hypothetical protein
MQYEKADGRCGDKPGQDDPAFRSHQAWKKIRSKPSRTADGRAVSTIEFIDDDWWRCQLALEREKLRALAGA